MLTVVKISQGRGPYYKVEFSNGEKLRLSEDTVVRHRLLKGQELDEKMLDEIKQEGKEDLGFQLALNYLSYQLRSKKEIFTYLKEKEIVPEDRVKIVQRLEELRLLDDAIFSESYVRTAMRTSDKGPRNVAQQLKQKGISEEDIQHGLTFYTLDEQLNVATATAEKAMKRYRTKSFKDALQKTRLHLMQKGFTNEIIDLALESLAFEKDEEQEQQALNKEGERLWRANQRFDFSKKVQKVKQSLFQKGFDYDLIQQFISEKEVEHDE